MSQDNDQGPPRHLITWDAIDEKTWQAHIAAARRYYERRRERIPISVQRSLALVFFNASLRTRTSMEVAGAQLGAHVSTIIPGSGTWDFEWKSGGTMDGRPAEHISEAIGVLSRYYDAIGVRVFASGTNYAQDRDDTLIHTIVQSASVPVINLESAFHHPCQALGDAATIHTQFDGDVRGKKFVLTWAYHPRALPMAVPNSALLMAARLGMQVTVARPYGFGLDGGILAHARTLAARHGYDIEETTDQKAAFEDADVIYAKAWGGRLRYKDSDLEASMRQGRRDWRVTSSLMEKTGGGVFMHCLPVRRGVVVDDAVLDGPQAIHLLQAEYRLYAQKAILAHLWSL